ncbi:MAG: hypothetical protein IJ573_07295 [Clostridia bacterium]|nr:hypothetical protein [Clostridia bacterium]
MNETLRPARIGGCALLASAGAAALGAYFSVSSAALFLCCFGLFYAVSALSPGRREIACFSAAAAVFALGRLFGHSYDRLNSHGLVFKSAGTMALSFFACCALFLSALCFCILLRRMLSGLSGYALRSKPLRPSEARLLFFSMFFVLFLGSVPYLLLYAPGLNIADTRDQILQYFGYPSVIGDGSVLTDHHPLLTTLLYALFMRLGLALGSANAGQLLYSVCSLAAVSLAMAGLLLTLVDQGISEGAARSLAVFLALWPVTALYAFNMCKDVSVLPCVLLYCRHMLKLWRSRGEVLRQRGFAFHLFANALLMMLLRKSAVYALLFAFILLLPCIRPRLRLAAAFVGAAAVYFVCSLLVLPALGVMPGETREMLSVPFQQSARTLAEYDDATGAERAALSRVLDVESAPLVYDPRLSDPVKDATKPDFTAEDLRAYASAWLSMGVRHPSCYISAWANLVYGYFYPSEDNTIVCLTLNSPDQGELRLTQDEGLSGLRLQLHNFLYYRLRRIPGFGCLFYVDTVTWIFLFLLTALAVSGGYAAAAPWGFFLGQALICLLSPKSGEIRYLLPVLYALPAMAGALLISLGRRDADRE